MASVKLFENGEACPLWTQPVATVGRCQSPLRVVLPGVNRCPRQLLPIRTQGGSGKQKNAQPCAKQTATAVYNRNSGTVGNQWHRGDTVPSPWPLP
eukprot:365652-Chlamydomonas_euryale.AAC.14